MGMEMLGMGLLMAGASALQSRATTRAAAKQAKAQSEAAAQAKQQAEREAENAREQMRMQQSKAADVSSILAQNTSDLLSGGDTMLTGAAGVDNSELTLGKKSTLSAS